MDDRAVQSLAYIITLGQGDCGLSNSGGARTKGDDMTGKSGLW